MFLGPNAPIGHGSVFTLSEHIAKYITGAIRKCQTEGIRSLVPSRAAVDDYFEHVTAFMPRTAWAAPIPSSSSSSSPDGNSGSRSWFQSDDGHVTALHPGSRIHFFHMLERFRGEDWEYDYLPSGGEAETEDEGDGVKRRKGRNRFAYLGNGFSTKELDPASDSTWYLDEDAIVR